MKSLVFIVLLVLAGIAGYNFINKPTESVEPIANVKDVTTPATNPAVNNDASPSAVENIANVESTSENEATLVETDGSNMTTPADMPEEAQHKMYSTMMEYNKCMLSDRPEYHHENTRTEDIAGKTLAECESNLDTLKEILEANDVNADLREGMIKTVRQRATRKLMGAVMQSQAASLMSHQAPAATQ